MAARIAEDYKLHSELSHLQLLRLHSWLVVDSDVHSLTNAQWMCNNGVQMAQLYLPRMLEVAGPEPQ